MANPLAPAASTLDSLLPIIPAVNVRLEAMPVTDRMRLRAAAFRATRVYPGPVGNLICKELQAWEEIGIRLGGHGPIMSLVDHVEKAVLPVFAQPLAEQILASASHTTDTTLD